MKPKAWLKSLNTNFFVIASRPDTSDQPLSPANADLRASPVSLPLMIEPHSACLCRVQSPGITRGSTDKSWLSGGSSLDGCAGSACIVSTSGKGEPTPCTE